MAEKVKDYSGACWNALIEEETKESIARLYIDSLDASRAEKAAAAEMLEALRTVQLARINGLFDAAIEHQIAGDVDGVFAEVDAALAKHAAKP